MNCYFIATLASTVFFVVSAALLRNPLIEPPIAVLSTVFFAATSIELLITVAAPNPFPGVVRVARVLFVSASELAISALVLLSIVSSAAPVAFVAALMCLLLAAAAKGVAEYCIKNTDAYPATGDEGDDSW